MATKGVEIQAEGEEAEGTSGWEGDEDGGLNSERPHTEAEETVRVNLGETAMVH